MISSASAATSAATRPGLVIPCACFSYRAMSGLFESGALTLNIPFSRRRNRGSGKHHVNAGGFKFIVKIDRNRRNHGNDAHLIFIKLTRSPSLEDAGTNLRTNSSGFCVGCGVFSPMPLHVVGISITSFGFAPLGCGVQLSRCLFVPLP